jgi:hypothetical protein
VVGGLGHVWLPFPGLAGPSHVVSIPEV